jgi:hypothetical protein
MPSSAYTRKHAARDRSVRICHLSQVVLGLVLMLPAFAQTTPQQRYVISIGPDAKKVMSGAIWLYSFSYYGLQKLQLANIENGLALVPLDTDKLKRELKPHPNTDGYVVALQIDPYHDHLHYLWYRTSNIAPDVFWSDLPGAVNSLGQATASNSGETQLILPSPTKRHITLLYLDGRPAENADMTVSIYLWNNNHCEGHIGLPLGSFRTDKRGTIEVLAPLVALYLDDIFYYETVGTGPAGVAYSNNTGLKLSAEENVILKEGWQLIGDDSLLEEFELRVLTAAGQPRSGVNIYGQWRTNTCGGRDNIGQTDSKGIARIDLDPSFTALGLMTGDPYSAGGSESKDIWRDLTGDELRELFTKHKLTIRW